MFKDRHIPYAVLAVLMGLLCNILPLVLILLYSFRRTHVILNCFPLPVRTMLFPFMDTILACYKDGTNGTRNCRYFGVVYHLAFIVIFSGFLTESILLVGVHVFMCIIIGMSVAVIQPYKSKAHNIVDTVLIILSVSLCFVACTSIWIAGIAYPRNSILSYIITVIPYVIPLLYIIGYLGLMIGRKCYRSLHCKIIKLVNRQRSNEMNGISENTALLQ